MFLNAFLRHADTVKLANLAQLVNVIAPIVTDKNGMFLQTIYWPLLEYGKQRGNQSLDLLVNSPKYEYNGRQIGYLDVSSTWNAKTRTLFLNVLNRSATSDYSAQIDNVEGQLVPDVAVWEMDNADLKAVNTFENDKKVRPEARTVHVDLSHNGFTYNFPKHSLTILTLKMT